MSWRGSIGAALLALSLAACSTVPGDEPLELVKSEEELPEPVPRPRWEIEFELRSEGEGAPELRVPLPDSDARQTIASLLWQVPEGEFDLEERGGRWLVARAARVRMRVRFLREGEPVTDPPTQVQDAANALAGRGPAEWVAGAQAASLTARVVHGLQWEGSVGRLSSWAEVRLPGSSPPAWVAVNPANGQLGLPHALRLGTAAPEARRASQPSQLSVHATVRPGEGNTE